MHQQGRLQLPYFRSSQVIRCIFKNPIAFRKLSTRSVAPKMPSRSLPTSRKIYRGWKFICILSCVSFWYSFWEWCSYKYVVCVVFVCWETSIYTRCNVRVQRDSVNAHTFHCVHPKNHSKRTRSKLNSLCWVYMYVCGSTTKTMCLLVSTITWTMQIIVQQSKHNYKMWKERDRMVLVFATTTKINKSTIIFYLAKQHFWMATTTEKGKILSIKHKWQIQNQRFYCWSESEKCIFQ